MAKDAVIPPEVILNRVDFSIILRVNQTHLLVPVANAGKGAMHLAIYQDARLVQSFTVRLPAGDEPFWTAAYPLDYFGLKGQAITLRAFDGKPQPAIFQAAFSRITTGSGLPAESTDDYSTDNGLTLHELPGNPVVRHSGRDPKVIWYVPEAKWVMAVSITKCARKKIFTRPQPKSGTLRTAP